MTIDIGDNNFEAEGLSIKAKKPNKIATALGTTTEELQNALSEYKKDTHRSAGDKINLARFLNRCDANELRSALNITAIQNAPIVATAGEKTSKKGGMFALLDNLKGIVSKNNNVWLPKDID